MSKNKFPKSVARFFNPEKSLVIQFDERRKTIKMDQKGTHQDEKRKEKSYIPVYISMGTARKVLINGKVSYK